MAFPCIKNSGRECEGCGSCSPDHRYFCPICGEEIYETVFVDKDGDVIGCENCAEIKEPYEVLENETD